MPKKTGAANFSPNLARVRDALARSAPADAPATLFFAVSDGAARARVVHASARSFDAAWKDGVAALRRAMARPRLAGRWLRVDMVTHTERLDWRTLKERLRATKRNYFRHGIALDEGMATAFTEQELNANAMLYGGAGVAYAVLNEKNFAIYAKARFGDGIDLDFSDAAPVWIFETTGVFADEGGVHLLTTGAGRDAGRRDLPPLDAEATRAVIADGADYLARQVGRDGSFDYGCFPCFDRPIGTHNALRSASSTYALAEAFDVLRDKTLKSALERAVRHLTTKLIKTTTLPDGTEAAFLVDHGDEIKLGGNAVAILALAKYAQITETTRHHALMAALGHGIGHMQDPDGGGFVHVLDWPGLGVKERFRIIYYDGEAAFALMRLHALSGEKRWLDMAHKAFDHFEAQGHHKAHDHWLAYFVDELTRIDPDPRFFRFAVLNVADHLDFVLNRITTFPTLLELMMASRRVLSRAARLPKARDLSRLIDTGKFERALHARANYLLNGHFWPEFAMFFKNPERVVHSFFIRHHAFRVRIDDVEHYLSGLIAYLKHLEAPHPALPAPRAAVAPVESDGWDARAVALAARGTWVVAPPEGWRASSLCMYAPAMQPDAVVAVRAPDGKAGIAPHMLGRLPFPPAALLSAHPESLDGFDVPILAVADEKAAILAMGAYARSRMQGRILAVTGSAGKTTTVAMLGHALETMGPVGRTTHNANLPLGVAWNLASIPWDVPHVVMELSIGSMPRNSALARPDVAVVTAIGPAHLKYHATVEEVARKKSAIFHGMSAGGVAVLNADMEGFDIFNEAAAQRRIEVLPYGTRAGCALQLLDFDAAQRRVRARFGDRRLDFLLGAAGRHMAMNALAVLGATAALGHPLDPVLERLEAFAPVEGRGAVLRLLVAGRTLTLIDEAYNANPLSMAAALETVAETREGRKVLILGDMLELGDDEALYHRRLAPQVRAAGASEVILCGPLMKELADELSDLPGLSWYPDAKVLRAAILGHLRDGDLVLVKSSLGTRLIDLVADLRSGDEPRH